MKKVCQWFWKVSGTIMLVAFVIFLVLLVRACSADWYPGIVHAHSTFSDGDRTPAMLKNAAGTMGCKFLIVTDHYEQINEKKKSLPRMDLFTDDFGYDNYIKQFFVTEPFLCLPGSEITTGDGSHILALDNTSKVFQASLSKVDQQEVINKLNELEALSVVAHPHAKQYFVDEFKASDICGIEFFNENTVEYRETFGWYLKLIRSNKSPFVTAGCDSHCSTDPTVLDTNRWQRKTFAWLDGELTSINLIDAFRKGRTYAANYGAYIKSINYLPGVNEKKVDWPSFKIKIGFPKKTTSEKAIYIYRDGNPRTLTEHQFLAGEKELECNFEDDDASAGWHSYVIVVDGCLVTSPIKIEVSDAIVKLDVSYDGWTSEMIDKIVPVNKGNSNDFADQAYNCVKTFWQSFNSCNKQAIKDCFIKPENGKEMAEKSTGEYWRRTAKDTSISKMFRDEARHFLDIIDQNGLPKYPTNKPTVVIVDRENKTATVVLNDFTDPLTSETFLLKYQLKRIDDQRFKIENMETSGTINYPGSCCYALKKSRPYDYHYTRRF
ncbi:MAG: hypothetical protein WCV58_02985 [Patescibacteria group bacterium]